MSGIAGVVQWDGTRPAPASLQTIAAFLSFRGPDAQRIWHDGPAGLVHSLFRTTRDAENESQPLSLNGATITADARLDAREDLIAALSARGQRVAASACDAALILHAWHAWAEDCIEHLLGDFAFSVWDERRQLLFCARDHFGVKPFYYALPAGRFLFSNTLEVLKQDSSISSRLNEHAVADFLLHGYNRNAGTTLFAGIQRLPPAHTLIVTRAGQRLRNYWSPAEGEPLRYRRRQEYTEHFLELLRTAVRDRLRVPRATIHMSGGLDSCSVAAVAKNLPADEGVKLRAVTLVSAKLMPDEEQHFGGLTAAALGIPIEYLDVDPFSPYGRASETDFLPPEPLHEPFLTLWLSQLRHSARHSRVAMTGQGGDPAFSTSVTHYARTLLRNGQMGRFATDFGRFTLAEGRLGRLYLRKRMELLRERRRPAPAAPEWLRPGVANSAAPSKPSGKPGKSRGLRPTAVQALSASIWAYQFELCDPGVTRVLVECRHPYFDLRLLSFLLRLPPVPWCTDKELVRVAMKGLLPDAVRLRGKTPLEDDPLLLHLRQPLDRWWDGVRPHPILREYVDWEKVPRPLNGAAGTEAWSDLAPVSLNLWLQGVDKG